MGKATLSAVLAVKYGFHRVGKCCHQYTLTADVLKKIGTLEAYKKYTTLQETSTSTSYCTVEDWDLSEF